jgi:hypothetical protein
MKGNDMGKKIKTPITIDGEKYNFEDLTNEQQILFNHCIDLDRKIDSARFNLDQLLVGKEAFIERLKMSFNVSEPLEVK